MKCGVNSRVAAKQGAASIQINMVTTVHVVSDLNLFFEKFTVTGHSPQAAI